MPAILDRIVEEPHGQLDMDAGAVAGLAVGIDRAAVPHRLQRIDRRRHDAARRLSVGCRDEADAARVALIFGTVHAMFGKAGMFGGREVGHRLAPLFVERGHYAATVWGSVFAAFALSLSQACMRSLTSRPSRTAHTTRLAPRTMSPAANTPGSEVCIVL